MATEKRVTLPPEYDDLHVGVALFDPEAGAVLDANDWVETILGYAVSELRGLPIEAYTANTYPRSGDGLKARLRASTGGRPQRFTWRAKRADGELVWVQVRSSRRRVDGRECVYAELQDITEYYDTYHRAELFWRVLRHNLRNEATVIAGNATPIAERAEAERLRKAGETIRLRAEKLGQMADSVEEIQRAVAGGETQRVEKHATVAVRTVANEVAAEHPDAVVAVAEREAMWVDVDDAFVDALSHAIENAIVHAETPEPTVEVSVGPSPNTGRVEIRISDGNPPIPESELDALFDPDTTTSTSHGTGIGLFVMKWCVESLGGEVRFERSDGGNDVYFYLPPETAPDEG